MNHMTPAQDQAEACAERVGTLLGWRGGRDALG
jgi:hypothetical protein